jgi:CBS domain-containing protein
MSAFPLDISNYMSTVLVVITPSRSIAEAIRLMRLHDVRHLPVIHQNKVVGVLTQRDVYLMRSLEGSDPARIQVSEAMTSDPYTVEPDEPVDRVAREMVRRKIGSTLVTHGDRLRGVFTTSDALLALAALVENDRIPDEPDEPMPEARVEVESTRRAAAKRKKAKAAAPRKGRTAKRRAARA